MDPPARSAASANPIRSNTRRRGLMEYRARRGDPVELHGRTDEIRELGGPGLGCRSHLHLAQVLSSSLKKALGVGNGRRFPELYPDTMREGAHDEHEVAPDVPRKVPPLLGTEIGRVRANNRVHERRDRAHALLWFGGGSQARSSRHGIAAGRGIVRKLDPTRYRRESSARRQPLGGAGNVRRGGRD